MHDSDFLEALLPRESSTVLRMIESNNMIIHSIPFSAGALIGCKVGSISMEDLATFFDGSCVRFSESEG